MLMTWFYYHSLGPVYRKVLNKSKLQNYVERWKLEVNLKKSKVLIFGSRSQRSLYITSKWCLGRELLQCVHEYVYLGITFHYSGRFKVAQRMLYGKALGAYHGIFKNFSNLDSVPVKVLLKLFSALVCPILLYCSEVWGVHLLGRLTNIEMFKKKFFSMNSDIEKLHIKFCKRILGAKSTNLAVIAELGRYPMHAGSAEAKIVPTF